MGTVFVLCCLLWACATPLPNDAGVIPATVIPTDDDATLCERGTNATVFVEARVVALETVYRRRGTCNGVDTAQLLYDTYIIAGDFMRDAGSREVAIAYYEDAITLLPEGVIAQARLADLSPEVTETPSNSTCDTDTVRLPDYVPTEGNFATLDDFGFLVNNAGYPIYGVNYYPSQSPFEKFLVETDLDAVATEFGFIADAGLNTVRLFLHSDVLFVCDALPNPSAFAMLEEIIRLADAVDLRLIMVLNVGVDAQSLFLDDVYAQQTDFITQRYADESRILAWDIYEIDSLDGTLLDAGLVWLADIVLRIRQADTAHPITVSWGTATGTTAPLVDFVSFQHVGSNEALRQTIANLQASTTRPLLLSSIGYSTFDVGEIAQRDNLFSAFDVAENTDLMGWAVSWAFDFPRTATCIPPDCPGEAQAINQFGLWNSTYFPKLSLEAITAQINGR
ncbi:MAG: hypothetical protein AAFR81_17285 [Chloroflexota bacterium]